MLCAAMLCSPSGRVHADRERLAHAAVGAHDRDAAGTSGHCTGQPARHVTRTILGSFARILFSSFLFSLKSPSS